MVLSDYIDDFVQLKTHLDNCKDFFDVATNFIKNYYEGISFCTNSYFKSTSGTRNNDLGVNLNTKTKEFYNDIRLLNSRILFFARTLGKIETLPLNNPLLKSTSLEFTSEAYALMQKISDIIIADIAGIQKRNLSSFLQQLNSLITKYITLQELVTHFKFMEALLFEPLPTNIAPEELKTLELRSVKTNIRFSDFSYDISNLSSFLEQLDIILSKNEKYTPIFVRKIETGSLRVVWGGTELELNCISDIIKAISEAIRTFRLTGAEKRLKEETARSLKLDNDAKALVIINSQIDTIAGKVGLDSQNPEDQETLQRLCLPLVKYINNNPVGKIGDTEYNLTNDIKLLEDYYFRNN